MLTIKNNINCLNSYFIKVTLSPHYLDTPLEPGYFHLEDDDNSLPNNTNYRQAVGASLYVATATKPDISDAVNIPSR